MFLHIIRSILVIKASKTMLHIDITIHPLLFMLFICGLVMIGFVAAYLYIKEPKNKKK